MARLPAYVNRAGLDTGADTFRVSNNGEEKIGQGVAQLGSGIFNAGYGAARANAAVDAKAEAKAEQAAAWHDELQHSQLRERVDAYAEQQKDKVGEDGAGYTKSVEAYARQEYDALRETGKLSRKDGLRNDVIFEKIRTGVVNKASQWEAGTQNQFRSRVSEDRIKEELAVVAIKGAAGQDEAHKNWGEFVERTMGTTSRQGQIMLQFGNKRIERTSLEAEAAKRGPEFVSRFQGQFSETPSANTKNPLVNATLKYAPSLGVDPRAMVAAGWIESRLNPNHEGPRLSPGEAPALGRKGKTHKSSAEGGWQFLDKDVTSAGLTLADKFDPEKSTALIASRYAANQRAIEGMGQQATPGKLYMMHNVGAGVGSLMLKVDPSTPIEDVFYRANPSNPRQAAQALRNNPSMYRAGQTVGQVLANYERQVGIGMKETARYFDGSQSATGEQATAVASSFMGREVKHLSTADVAEIFVNVSKNVKTATKEDDKIAQGSYFLSNAGTADQYDASHKSSVNAAFEARYGSAIVDGVSQGDPEALKVLSDSTRAVGFVPDKALHGVRAALNGTNVEAATNVLIRMADIDKTNPRAFDATALTSDDRDAVNSYAALTNVLGLHPAEATKRVMFDRSPEGRKAKEAFAEKFKAEWRNGTNSDVEADAKNWKDVASYMSKGQWFNSDAVNDTLRENMVESYKKGITYHRLQGRNLEDSKAMALKQLDDTWGRSTVTSSTGETVLTMFPPEKVLGAEKALDGSFDWVKQQADFQLRRYLTRAGKLKSILPESAAEYDEYSGVTDKTPEFRMIAAPGSSSDVAAGRPVSYQLWYSDEKGRKQIAVGEMFTPNYADAKLHSDTAARARREKIAATKAATAESMSGFPAAGGTFNPL